MFLRKKKTEIIKNQDVNCFYLGNITFYFKFPNNIKLLHIIQLFITTSFNNIIISASSIEKKTWELIPY